MNFPKKHLSVAIISALSLTACIEVDDDSNNELVETLNQQNQILSEQNDLLNQQIENEQATFSVTFAGAISDVISNADISGAQISVLRGNEVLTDLVSDENGGFEITDLPPSTDITLLITSTDNAFVDRVFYFTTPPIVDSNVYRDIGRLLVSEPVTLSFSVTNEQNGDPVIGLEFIGLSHSGALGSTAFDYAHRSTFNDTTNQYEIVLPRYLRVSIEAILDLDGDGAPEFDRVESGNASIVVGKLIVSRANELEALDIRLTDENDAIAETKTISIQLLDEANQSLVGGTFLYDEEGNVGQVVYDDSVSQYTAELPFDGSLQLNMGSFMEDEKTYSSGSINVSRETNFQTGETQLRVSTNGFNSNSFYRIPDTDNVQIVLVGREVQPSSDLEVITASVGSDNNYALSAFYSEPVNLSEGQVSLAYDNVTVIAGDENANDNVPNGTTVIDEVQVDVPISLSTELNDARIIVTPGEQIKGNTEYRYEIGNVSAKSDGIEVALGTDDRTFTTPIEDSSVFAVDSLVVDNQNFYSNGAILRSENSAGIESTFSERDRFAYLFLPTSIEGLEYLTITVTSYTENNSDFPRSNLYNVVENNRVMVSKLLAISVAENENVQNLVGRSYVSGTTLPNGQYFYRLGLNEYLGDNKPSDVNAFTISYEYRVEGSDSQSGELVLPVR